jgi:hypothetical protein
VSARRLFALALACASVAACRKESPDPARTVLSLVDDVRRADEDPERAKHVVASLPAATRRDLDERAKRASIILGRRVEPTELVADAFVVTRFDPVRTTTTIRNDRATVELFGANEAVEHARVTCILDGDHWAVELPFSETTSREATERPRP